MNDKPPPTQEDAVPRKMSLLGHKTASERAVRTLRKNWTMPGSVPALPAEPPVETLTGEAQPDTLDIAIEQAVEVSDTPSPPEKKKKDKKKKSKKKKNKDKKPKGKKGAK